MTSVEPAPIDVLLLDRHRSYREAIGLYLASRPGFGEILNGGSGRDGLDAVRRLRERGGPQRTVILINVTLEDVDSLEIIPELCRTLPRAAIVTLSGIDDPARLGRMVEAGATAILPKSLSLVEIEHGVRQAAQGRLHLEPHRAVELLRAAARERVDRQQAKTALAALSARERQILCLISDGQTDREIAAELSISYETVRSHVANILRKLQVNSRTAAILFAVRHRMLEAAS